MSRDFEKARRQDMARKALRLRGSDSRHHQDRPVEKSIKHRFSPVTKLLRVECPDFVADSFWTRSTNGSWRCTKAAPIIEWFTRVRHPDVIHNWLSTHHCSFMWLTVATPVGTELIQNHPLPTGPRPAVAYPAPMPSAPSGVNTPVRYQPIDCTHARPDAPVSAAPERNGLPISSPLNSPARAGNSQAVSS